MDFDNRWMITVFILSVNLNLRIYFSRLPFIFVNICQSFIQLYTTQNNDDKEDNNVDDVDIDSDVMMMILTKTGIPDTKDRYCMYIYS